MSSELPAEHVTKREGEVLRLLGMRLTNQEIATELFISVRTVESHVSSLLRKYRVSDRAALSEIARAAWSTSGPVLPRNSFVGRSHELEVLGSMLDRHRLVTIVGPGGAGKTRLALELTRTLPSHVFVDLGTSSHDAIIETIATSMGVGPGGRPNLLAAVALALDREPCVLILDNCDRLEREVRSVVAALLAREDSVRILATSRTALGSSEEATFQLGPLSVGDLADGAERLFLDRAAAAAPEAPVENEIPFVRAICRRLDGLPLAIELAAARVRHHPPRSLLGLLDRGLELLDDPLLGDPESTLSATFSWSWSALDPGLQAGLSRLAALPGGFDLELASAVGVEEPGTVVTRLLDRSMISPASGTSPQRFRLLAPIREFVLSMTDGQMERDVRARHAAFVKEAIERAARTTLVDDSRQSHDDARRLIEPAMAAARWALDNDVPLSLVIGRSLAIVLEQVGPTVAALDIIHRIADDPDAIQEATPQDLQPIGLAILYVDLARGSELGDLALEKASDPADQLSAHLLAGTGAAYLGLTSRALDHLATAKALAVELEDDESTGLVEQARGIALSPSDPEGAMVAFAAALAAFARAGDGMHVNNARYMMAATAAHGGAKRSDAIRWADESIEYATRAGLRHELAHARLARAALGDIPRQEEILLESLDVFRSVGDLRCVSRSLLAMARLGGDGADQLSLEALTVAVDAADVTRQTAALEQLADSRWQKGDERGAMLAIGALTTILGDAEAMAAAPPGVAIDDDHWHTILAEGRARGPAGIIDG